MQKLQKRNVLTNKFHFLKAFLARFQSFHAWQELKFASSTGGKPLNQVNIPLSFHFTRKNIFMVLQKPGGTLMCFSAGALGFKGGQKKTLEAGLALLEKASKFILNLQTFSFVSLHFVGTCSWKRVFLRRLILLFQYKAKVVFNSKFSLLKNAVDLPVAGSPCVFYNDALKIPFNGCRKRKPRRV